MASPQRISLERSLDQFRRELSDDQRREISGVNQKVLNHAIQEMQAKLGRDKGLCKLTRIEKFLHVMQDIEKIVTIFLNVSEVVAFIWGPIKLALMAATTWKDCVRQLVDVYEEIADALDNLAFFHKLVQKREHEHLRLILEDYFSDILRFHRCVLDVFSRPDWKRLFKWAWGSFRREIKPIIESLKRRQAMLSDDKLLSHAILKEVQDSHEYENDQFRQLKASLDDIKTSLAAEQLRNKSLQDEEMRASLESKLDVSMSRIYCQLHSSESTVGPSGNWIFTHPTFDSWDTNKILQGDVLFLNGCPGAGKSTLIRLIIRHLQDRHANAPRSYGQPTFFFYRHDDADRRSTRSMLRHVMMQLINTDQTIMRFVYDKCSSMDYLDLSVLKELAQECLTSQQKAVLVLDGLDEATGSEPESSLRWCLNELLPVASSRGCHLKLLICGQEDGRIEPFLSSYQHIRLHTVDSHRENIYEYSRSQAIHLRSRFSLTQTEEDDLVLKVVEASQGMFLYSKVVFANLQALDSVDEFGDEMENNNFPKNLEQAYDRIIERVLKNAGPSRQKSVRKILGWVICSARPLRWREIQSRFCIDAEKVTCNPRSRRVDSCKNICSSLVDVTACDLFGNLESEQAVTMIHETATKYLIHTGTVNLLQEHVSMALFCCRYLSSYPFLEAEQSDGLDACIKSGYFGFMDYAAVHYKFHAQKLASCEDALGSTSESKTVVKAAMAGLSKVHFIPSTREERNSYENFHDLDLAIQARVFTIRKAVNTRQAELSQDANFLSLEGPERFKCPKLHCSKFAVGLSDQEELEKHLNRHERPFRCKYDDCFAQVTGYASQGQLKDHCESFHQNGPQANVTFPTVINNRKWDIREACKVGNLDEVKRFHLAGAELNEISTKLPPLCVAVKAGQVHVCKYLIENGVDPFQMIYKNQYLSAPICLAIQHKKGQILELFLNSGYHFQLEEKRLLLANCITIALREEYSPALELIFATTQTPDHIVMIKEVMKCLRSGPFRFGSRPHSIDATLVQPWFRKAFPNLYDQTGSLSLQSDCQDHKIYGELLLQKNYFLHGAFLAKCFPLAMFLIDIASKEDLQVQEMDGSTPLHRFIRGCCHEACSGCETIAQRIIQIDGGTSADIPNKAGELPAHLAVTGASLEIFRVILTHTKDLNHRDNEGMSLLDRAGRDNDRIQVLLECGFNSM